MGKPFAAGSFTNLPKTTETRSCASCELSAKQDALRAATTMASVSNYQGFRNYRSEWHDRNWWSGHSNNVVIAFGGWYALNRGYWYPAWGYDSNAYYLV